ncbi:TonB-dependent siderophore receptor [Scytonema sp. NUACC26]|uniref:TonB-dependent siderophore receptor n=1 Tax=Scytonema sp. NUACC26 TaxID=3140176 RepID=UPI0034DC6216
MNLQIISIFFWQSLLVTSSLFAFTVPVLGKEIPTRKISLLNQIKRPKTQMLVQSQTPTSQTEVISVTGVKVNSTDKGLEVILETGVKSDRLQVTPKIEGNSYIADIPNAQLRLISGDRFRESKPAAGIAEVTVTNVDANSIRVTVTGEALVPTVELFDSNEGLVFGVSTVTLTVQQPTQTTPKPANEDKQPIELEVIGTPEGSYQVPRTSVGTKTETPLRDIPQSIQIAPRQLIEDQGARDVQDVLKNFGIVQSVFGPSRSTTSFGIRGFEGLNTLRNGLRDNVNRSTLGTNLTNVERIEVLKGPGSILYGQGNPGGTVNIVTKQPLSEPYYSIELSGGSYDFYKPAIDFSGPVTSDKKLLYRLNVSYENSNYFRDYIHGILLNIAPVLTYRFNENTKLTLEAEYQNRSVPIDPGLPAAGTVSRNPNGKIPLERYLGEEGTDLGKRRTYRIGYDFEHRFNENWSLQNTFHLLSLNFDQKATFPLSLQANNRFLTRRIQEYSDSIWDNYIIDTHVVGKVNTGSIQHQLLLGFDLYRDIIFFSPTTQQNLALINVFNPVYRQPRGSIAVANKSLTRNDAIGIYLQDQIALTGNLKLLLGGRFDYIENYVRNTNFLTNRTTIAYQPDSAFSPRVGIVYQPIEPISLYASYDRSFLQNVGSGFGGVLYQPSRGTQYEVGVKTDWLNNKLSANLALYQLTFDNVLTNDLRNPGFNVQTGEQRSRGVELNLVGEILPGWNIIASYNYIDARITKDNTYKVGNRINNAPENSLSLWNTYIIPSGGWKGFGGGIGLYYVGEREGDLGNTFQLPSYFRTDAAIYYRRNNLNVALNLKNIFNVDYFQSARSSLQVYPGDPFTAEFTVRWQF